MTNLSPAAQAVLDDLHYQFYRVNGTHVAGAVYALRAAANHLNRQKGWSLGVRWSADELFRIADELEAAP